MFVAGLFASAIIQSPFVLAVERAARAVESTQKGSVDVSVMTRVGGAESRTTYNIGIARPNSIRLTIREPEQGPFDETHRSYSLSGRTAVAYDYRANEYLSRKVGGAGSLYEKTLEIVGDLGEPFGCAVSGTALKTTLVRFAQMGRWRATTTSAGTTYESENRTRGARLVVQFAPDGRLAKVDLAQQKDRSLWTYRYGTGAATSLDIPKGAKKVLQFTARPKPPRYEDAASKSTLESCIRAYSGLTRLKLDATGPESYRFWMSHRLFRLESDRVQWTYRSGKAEVLDRDRKTLFTGRVTPGELIGALGALGHPVPAHVRSFLLQNNPIVSLFSGDFKVRSAGSVQVPGMNIRIINVEGKYWSGLIDIDEKTRLVSKIKVENRDGMGRVVSRSTSSYRYSNVNIQLPNSLFSLTTPKGTVRASLKPYTQ